jgi:hypothetical protein
MSAGAIVAAIEIGSTYAKLVVFQVSHDRISLLTRSATRTTTAPDVRAGIQRLYDAARADRCSRVRTVSVSSSAAGGLWIAVCGLTVTLSTRIAVEVALNAGGIVVHTSSGALRPLDIDAVRAASPGLILLCGGADHGETDADACQLSTPVQALRPQRLAPTSVRHWLIDKDYIIASLGSLNETHEEAVIRFLEQNFMERQCIPSPVP